jgi:nucleotide-binding universal stress UspA family protein
MTPSSLVTEPVEVSRIVVPLDGSPFAERALPVADWIASPMKADVQLIQVAHADEDAEAAMRYLDGVERRQQGVKWDVLRRHDVPRALADHVADSPGTLVCLATHGRDRSAAALGSVAASLLDRNVQPLLLVGPQARVPPSVDAWVVVAVDGKARDEALVRIASDYATRLERPLLIATVAEPVPALHEGQVRHRAHGPADPEGHLAWLAERVSSGAFGVDTLAVYDPVGVRDGLVRVLERSAALVVLGSRRRRGVPRMLRGSHAARIVHAAPVPALVVPWPTRSPRR